MRLLVWLIAVVAGAAACQHAPIDTAKVYSARGLDVLAAEYLLVALADDPDDPVLREEASVLFERARWQLDDELTRLSPERSPGAMIGKWRALQDLTLLSVKNGFSGTESEVERYQRESKARSAIRNGTQELLDQRLSRGAPKVADLRLCREVASLDSETKVLTRTCDRISDELMTVAEIRLVGGNASRLSPERLAGLVAAKRLELFRLANDASGVPANAVLKVASLRSEVDEQDWFVKKRLPVRKWVERRDAEGRLVKLTVTQYPTKEEIKAAEEQGLPPPKPTKVEKQVWDEVSGEYFFFQKYREVRIPYRAELVNLRTSRTLYGHHGVSRVNSTRDYFQFSGDPRARVRDYETVPEGRRMVLSLESRESLVSRAIGQLETQVVDELSRKVD